MHPKVRSQCEAIAQTLRLNTCGIDYITADIEADPSTCKGSYIEVNSYPQNPTKKYSEIIENLFPVGDASEVPITAIISEWDPGDAACHKERTEKESLRREGPIIAYDKKIENRIKHLLSGQSNTLSESRRFCHPRELLLSRSTRSIIYLTTPVEVIRRGLPSSQNMRILHW